MSPVRTNFYNIFWEEELCRKIFTQHKEHLLEKEEFNLFGEKKVVYIRRIVISNELKFKNFNPRIFEQRSDNTDVEINEHFNSKITTEKAKFESFVETHFGSAINTIFEKVNAGTLSQVKLVYRFFNSLKSEENLVRFLKEHSILPPHINSFKELEIFFNKSLSQIIDQEFIISSIDAIDKASELYTNAVYQNLFDASAIFIDTLFDTDNFTERLKFFDLLYEAKIISSGRHKTYYECLSCQEGVFKGVVALNVKPTQVKLKCPACIKEVFYLSPYEIHEEIFQDLVKDSDGILKPAAKFLLEQQKFTVKQNFIAPPNIEIDLVAVKDNLLYLFELKIYKTDTPEHTQISNLRTTIANFVNKKKEHLIKMDQSFERSEVIILTNYDNVNVFKTVKEELSEVLKINRIKIFNLTEFKQYIVEK